MPKRRSAFRPAGVSSSRDELESILDANPRLAQLVERQPDEPDVVSIELLCAGPSPYFVVGIPVPGRKGTVWASRLPGSRAPHTEDEVTALVRFGISRIVCLVPTEAIENLHRADRYLGVARTLYPEKFHQLEIPDHDIPPDDEELETLLRVVDTALREGENVLVHCVGGCGRTGVFTACLLVLGGMGPGEAIQHFRRYRRCGPETPEQVAYVVRYARRLASSQRAEPRLLPTAWCCTHPDGRPKLLARGGLGSVFVGRLRLADGRTRRVAVKKFARPLDAAEAASHRERIERLRQAGVHLPRMLMAELPEGGWAQISPLFGSLRRGSKLAQPAQFYRQLDEEHKRFAIDQLARVANAGYAPSIDLFLVFNDAGKGIVPLDLDLLDFQPEASARARALVRAVLQVGSDSRERDALLQVAYETARPAMSSALDRALAGEANAFRRLWGLK